MLFMTSVSPENINFIPLPIPIYLYLPITMAPVIVKVLFFASAREAAGCTSASVELDSEAADTKALR